MVGRLAKALLERCAMPINSRLHSLAANEKQDAYQDTIEGLFKEILDIESDQGDYFQVRFGDALKKLSISTFRKYSTRVNNEAQLLVPLSALHGHELEGGEQEQERENEPQAHTVVQDQDLSLEQRILMQEGLGVLPEPYRTAFILRYYNNWPIESDDPDVPTISKIFDKDPRTMRNWLNNSKRALEQWRGEKP